MDELGPDEQKWLDALRADEPSTTDRARVRAHVLAGIAASTAGATTATVAGAAKSGAVVKAGAGALLSTWKLGAIAVAVVAGGVAGALALRPTASVPVSAPAIVATPAVVDALPPTEVSPPAAPPEVGSAAPAEETPAVVAPRAPAIVAPRTTARSSPRSAPHSDDVDAELALLSQAQHALERGEPMAALGVLAQHAREHPRGALALEREGLRAVASCEAKRPDGRALAERFVAAHPTAPLVARVRAACLSP